MVRGQLVNHGQSISTNDCNACKCVFGATVCTQHPSCDTPTTCRYGDNLYLPQGGFTQTDGRECECLESGEIACEKESCEYPGYGEIEQGASANIGCKLCTCRNRQLTCRETDMCNPRVSAEGSVCNLEDGTVVLSGLSVQVDCNTCLCQDGSLVCTRRTCGSDEMSQSCILASGDTIQHGERKIKDCESCECSNGEVTCTRFCSETTGCQIDDMMLRDGQSYGDCVCVNTELICAEDGTPEQNPDIQQSPDTRKSCGTLDDGRLVFIGSKVVTVDGRECQCSESGSYLTCTSENTCLFRGRRVPVGQINNQCFCMYTGMVQCTSGGFIRDSGAGSDQINQESAGGMLGAGSISQTSESNQQQVSVSSAFKDSISTDDPNQDIFNMETSRKVSDNSGGTTSKYCGVLSDGRKVEVGEVITDSDGRTCKCSESGNFLECTSTRATCFYNRLTYQVGSIDAKCTCLNTGNVVCNSKIDVSSDEVKIDGIGSDSDSDQIRITSDQINISGEVQSLINIGSVASQASVKGISDGSCRIGDIMYPNGQFIGYGQETQTCSCKDGSITCAETAVEGCPMESGAVLEEGQSVQLALYTCLCKAQRLICSLSRSCFHLGAELANGQVVMNNGQKCVCLENKMMCYPVGSCFLGGRVLTDGQVEVSVAGEYCTCTNGELSCAVTEVFCEVGDVNSNRRLEVGEMIKLTDRDCTCTRSGLECSEVTSYCEFTVPSGETHKLARKSKRIIPGLGKCTCKTEGLQCLKGCYLGDIVMNEGETAVSNGKICDCSSNSLTCRAGYTCYIEGDIKLVSGENSGRCKCGVGELSCEGVVGWEVQAACVADNIVVQEGATVPYRCGYCKCSRGVLGCYHVNC